MSHRAATLVFLATAVVICAAASSPLNTADATKSAAKPTEPSADVEQLLRERLQVLQEIVGVREAAYKQGEDLFLSVLAAREDVLSAKLELAKTPAERIEVLEGRLKIARAREEATAELLKTARVGRVDYLQAKAHRLRVQVDLTRERSTTLK